MTFTSPSRRAAIEVEQRWSIRQVLCPAHALLFKMSARLQSHSPRHTARLQELTCEAIAVQLSLTAHSQIRKTLLALANTMRILCTMQAHSSAIYTNPHYYGGSYYLPPVTNFSLMTAYLAANPTILPLDVAATAQASDASNYNLHERVGAFYVMDTLALSAKLHLQVGLRVETTNTSDTGYLVTTNADGSYGGTRRNMAAGPTSIRFQCSIAV